MDPTILVTERLGYTQTRRNKLMIAMNKNMAKPMHIPEVTYETSAAAHVHCFCVCGGFVSNTCSSYSATRA